MASTFSHRPQPAPHVLTENVLVWSPLSIRWFNINVMTVKLRTFFPKSTSLQLPGSGAGSLCAAWIHDTFCGQCLPVPTTSCAALNKWSPLKCKGRSPECTPRLRAVALAPPCAGRPAAPSTECGPGQRLPGRRASFETVSRVPTVILCDRHPLLGGLGRRSDSNGLGAVGVLQAALAGSGCPAGCRLIQGPLPALCPGSRAPEAGLLPQRLLLCCCPE